MNKFFQFQPKAGIPPLLFVLFAVLIMGSGAEAQTVVFEADFDASTAVSGTVTANASAANLDVGTQIGSWEAGVSAPGAVISDGAGNHAFVFDKATSGLASNSVGADFVRRVDLYRETLSLELELYAVRQANNQAVVFSLDDASGNQAFEFVFQMNNNKKFFTTGSDGTASFETVNATGSNNGFKNPAVDGFLTWGTGSLIGVKLDITAPSQAALSIDWNGDGDYEDSSEWSGFDLSTRGDGVTEISSLRISNLSNRNGGAWIDNVKATTGGRGKTLYNLAKYQTTTADSSLTNWPPQFASDGFLTQDSRWVTPSGGPHWLEVALAVPMEIGSAHLLTGGTFDSAMANAVMQYHDGGGWVDIAGTTLSGNTARLVELAFATPVVAQRFRLYTTDAIARVVDLALYAPTPDGSAVPFGTDVDLNLAKMRQYEYSSVAGTAYPKLAIDGYVHNTSFWASADSAGPHDLEIHFPYAEKIGSVHLYSGYTGQSGSQIQDFEIAYESGGSWVPIPGGTITGNTELERVVNFTSPVNASKIRLRSNDLSQAVVRELVVLPEVSGAAFSLETDARNQRPPLGSFLDYEDSYFTIENRAEGTRLSTSDTESRLTTAEPCFQVLRNLGDESYRIRSKETEKCFEVALASTEEGAAIVEGDYSSMPHQRWELQSVGDGFFRIVNLWSGMALEWDGSSVVQQGVSDSPVQQWRINYETHYPKKGQASHFHFNPLFKPSWAYRWNFSEENQVQYGQYMPMQWGAMAAASPGLLRYQPEWFRRAKQTTLLGFNEPDLHDQANMTEETAAYQWPRLERTRLPLGGPVPAAYRGSWRQNYEAMAEERGYRCEYMTMHWYSTSGASTGSPSTLINNMKALYDIYGKPIWLTEFSTRDFVGDKTTWSRNHNFNFLAEFMWRAESLPWLKKYSVFEWSLFGGNPDTTDASSAGAADMNSPRLALHYANDSSDPGWEDLSECGLLLAGWDGVDQLVDDTSYIIHNKARFLRLIDHPDSSTVTTADVLNRTATEQFMLQSGPNGSKYIVGLSDGGRLSYDGSDVGLSPAGTTGSLVEWSLTEYEHGWFYIDHLSSNQRLRISNANLVDTVAASTTNDNVRFRFITHYNPISLAEVQSLPYAESYEDGVGAWRQFYDDGYDWEVGSGGTPSGAAGPSGASDGDSYLFAEGHDSSSPGDMAQVECVFDFSSADDVKLSFDYHMYGNYIDYLAVDIFDGTSWATDVWLKDNQQHTSSTERWSRAVVDLSAFAGLSEVTIRFRTARTQYNSADPAIDNVSVGEPVSIPYAESFEDGIGDWVQSVDDDYNWTLNRGGTPSAAAGPNSASDGEFYLYAEGHDSAEENDVSQVECTFDFSGADSVVLSFDYHMFGPYIAYLTLDVFDGTSWNNGYWLKIGPQHDSSEQEWSEAKVDLSSFAGNEEVTLRFRTSRLVWNSADPAIDNIVIKERPRALPYIETFETGLGSWRQVQSDDIDWTRQSGPTESAAAGPAAASEGNWYVYFEGHDSGEQFKSASLECSFDLSTVNSARMTFDYHMFGAFIDYLTVDIYDGSEWTLDVWRKDGQQHESSEAPWSTASVDLSSFVGNEEVTIRFTHQQAQWHSADPALDLIRVEELSDYELWAVTALSGAAAGADITEGGNPDGDAYSNVEEWALVLDPLIPDSPDLTLQKDGSELVVNFLRRSTAGHHVRAAWSTTLMPDSWRYAGDGLIENLLETLDDVEVMEARIPMDSSEKFFRLEIWEIEH
ncbi:glycosyl hydrolase [Roseibacillus persicicus]|uniref:glycosyl hydrolase n=1 Tax=Roseibacillus persicicus TaxID=454148 RepID=UPI00280CB1C4|nr:glycosyl hydrolase [Roseibacillus persicicus]MDQ8190019.1 glycosyl hydrolase [Roseibacillus persicicus]